MTCPPGFWYEQMRHAGWGCARCGSKDSLTLSHRLAAARGGPFTSWNIDVLCGSGTDGCHGWVEANPEHAEADGWRVPGQIVRGRYHGPDATFRRTVDRERQAAA